MRAVSRIPTVANVQIYTYARLDYCVETLHSLRHLCSILTARGLGMKAFIPMYKVKGYTHHTSLMAMNTQMNVTVLLIFHTTSHTAHLQ